MRKNRTMPSAILKSSGLCALALILLTLAAPVRAGDGGGDGGGENERFQQRVREKIREEKQEANDLGHAVIVVGALDGLQGSEPGDSVTTP